MALRTWFHQPIDRTLEFREVLDLPNVHEHMELRSRFGFLAFHGGNLERRTDWIAWDAAERSGSSVYSVSQPPGRRHHYPSASVHPRHSSRLASFVDHCDVVISVHGFGRHGHWDDLLCGGRNRTLAAHAGVVLRSRLPDRYNVVTELDAIPRPLRGMHPDNPVNLPRGAGMQLELPPGVRGLTPA
ncbi:MAG: replication protein, partial [Acidimicrobiales bacterium]|nr:replication protein [Acidimicrobiales bacterium]